MSSDTLTCMTTTRTATTSRLSHFVILFSTQCCGPHIWLLQVSFPWSSGHLAIRAGSEFRSGQACTAATGGPQWHLTLRTLASTLPRASVRPRGDNAQWLARPSRHGVAHWQHLGRSVCTCSVAARAIALTQKPRLARAGSTRGVARTLAHCGYAVTTHRHGQVNFFTATWLLGRSLGP
jgi:hypothetical protein